jgi:enoyl-[acyl-carrier protein] reductase I
VRYLAAGLGASNIRVNAVSAGPVKTLAAMGIKDFSSVRQVYGERTPLRRNVELAEIADAALFLLGPESRAITGEILFVDAASISSPSSMTMRRVRGALLRLVRQRRLASVIGAA